MFEDVFEPLDDIIDGGDAQEASDEWGDVWDTGNKEDMWRADGSADVWSVQPGPQVTHPGPVTPAPKPDPTITQPAPPIIAPPGPMKTPVTPENDQCGECDDGKAAVCEDKTCEAPSQGSGLFDDLF